ncbi:hypothetical protein Taro_014938 [Colocasia esculenta]|uniref:Uncharacterized protein n=1 Tax=Colocasia esculenta TaxID=4460 RepID=A0A843URN9_COLES|nr:hypothetical protein [Colocasia esculenta]
MKRNAREREWRCSLLLGWMKGMKRCPFRLAPTLVRGTEAPNLEGGRCGMTCVERAPSWLRNVSFWSGRASPWGVRNFVLGSRGAGSAGLRRTNISCQGSVDTTINGVDTLTQSKGRNVKKISSSVDTSPGQVDTRDLSQGFVLPVWESVSTHLMGKSTHSGISVT